MPTTEATLTSAPDAGAVAATSALFEGVQADEPGCTVAVRRGDDVVFAEAYGAARLDPLQPMTTATIVDIGSTSKQFTATAIALLVTRGQVGLDDTLADHLDGLPDWSVDVTVSQMIHHQSGIPDYIELLVDSGIDFADVATNADALAVLQDATELNFEPGESWEYSNSNYFLLGQIVLAITGQDLATFAQAEIFAPLAMAAVMDPVALLPAKATSYERVGAAWHVADSPWRQVGDGGVQTTPGELVRWAGQYWEPTIGGAEVGLLRSDTVEFEDGARYGFGIVETDFLGARVLLHSGSWGGFETTFIVVPQQQLAVAATCSAAEMVPESENDEIGLDIVDIWMAAANPH